MFPQNFRTQPFTNEELSRFTNALSKGRVSDVISLVSEMTPEKELEIQKLVNHFSPIFRGYEQKVKGFLDQLQIKESLQISEPQQEERVQALIDQELTFVKSRNKLEAAINELNSLKVANEEEASRVQDTIKEHKKMLKELEANVTKEVTLDNVRNILKVVTVVPERISTPPAPPESPAKELIKPIEEEKSSEETKTDAVKAEEPKSVESSKSEKIEEAVTPTAPVVPVEEAKIDELKLEDEVKKDAGELREVIKEEKELKVGSRPDRSCCGSKGLNHKKNCPTKNK